MSKRVWSLILTAALVATGLGFAVVPAGRAGAASAGGPPWADLVGPGFARYVPGTDQWEISLWVVGDGWGATPPGLAGVKASVDGKALGGAAVRLAQGPWAAAAGRVRGSEVAEVKTAATGVLRGQLPAPAARARLVELTGRLGRVIGEVPPTVLTVTGVGQVPAGTHWLDVTLDYKAGEKTLTVTEQVEVLVAAVAKEPGWFASDLHMHSTYSDGNKTVAGLKADLAAGGYNIGYVTDHVGSLRSAGLFDNMADTYPAACQAASDTATSMFPGTEMAVGHSTWLGWNGDGHSLAYGISSYAGLYDDYWGPQAGLDQINGNNSPLSSAGIAHPNHFWYSWDDWTVLRYYGIELMSGWQLYFDVGCGPMTRWRSECARLASYGYSGSFRPSVRSGSDYHSSWYPYVTQIKLPSDEVWYNGTWEDRWSAVSMALKNGRTTISRKGSLAFVTADGYDVGSTFAKAGGSAVSFSIYLKPIESGTYTLTLYQDNMAATVWSASSVSLAAGTPYTWSKTYTYPGGSHYYWLYVSGPDYCYTTPIYLHP